MSSSTDDPGPISAGIGEWQPNVDPLRLLPSRGDLIRSRLEHQRRLLNSGQARWTPIQVTGHGVIVDGHHAVRAAAEEGRLVDVLVSSLVVKPKADSILALPVR